MSTKLRDVKDLFREDADFDNISISDLHPEILKKKIFIPSDLNRVVIDVPNVVSTKMEFNGQVSSKFASKNEKSGEPGILYSKESFVHFGSEGNTLYLFQDYDVEGNPLENLKGRIDEEETQYFIPENILNAYKDDLIKTYTDSH